MLSPHLIALLPTPCHTTLQSAPGTCSSEACVLLPAVLWLQGLTEQALASYSQAEQHAAAAVAHASPGDAADPTTTTSSSSSEQCAWSPALPLQVQGDALLGRAQVRAGHEGGGVSGATTLPLAAHVHCSGPLRLLTHGACVFFAHAM
jgi:hypothetical protein